MHGHDFLVDVDVNASGQVNSPAALNIGIIDGVQINDFNTIGANRLLIFTGNAVNFGIIGHDDNVAHGVFRVRLRFPLPKSVIFKASATIAALAGLHGEGDEDLTFGADAAVIVTDPTDGGTLPQPSSPLPDNELYVIIDAGYQGDGSRLTRISYQANVLVQDLEPALESILVSPAGAGTFAPSAIFTVSGGNLFWDLQLNLTGPVPQDRSPFEVVVESDNNDAPLGQLVLINSPDSSTVLANNILFGTAAVETITITATWKNQKKTATLVVNHVT